ncbi:MAG: GntR family transcriptional regulator [Firmicutes bacterium]|jgi:GntR family transcriptional regulator|nr:GntR family transcriptional regulator [Bacillota bacterium]
MATNNPGLLVNHKSDIPLYVQVKNQIKHFISSGVWEAGLKLPTERELAAMLTVSRNTVSVAYKELEAEGYLVSRQGRGTFVAGEKLVRKNLSRKERLLKIIDLALAEATELGFSPDDFLSFTVARAQERKWATNKLSLAFVAAAKEQVGYFRRELKAEEGLLIKAWLLEEIRRDPEGARERLVNMDLIVTNLMDVDELRRLLEPCSQPIQGISLDLQLETIVRIARLPEGSTLALICQSKVFAERVKQALKDAGIHGLRITTSTAPVPELEGLVNMANCVAVSSDRLAEVLPMAVGMDVIELQYRLDTGSLNTLRYLLRDLRTQSETSEKKTR